MEPLEPRRLPASLVFANNYGSLGGGVATAEAVAMDQAGNAYVTGEFTGTVSFGGTSLTSAGAGDIYVAKFNSSGSVLWADRMGSASSKSDGGRGISLDSYGNVYVSGFFYSTSSFGGAQLTSAGDRDGFVEKLDPNGNVLWAKGFGGTGTDIQQGMAVDSSGNIFTTGTFQGTANFGGPSRTSAGGNDAFVVKLDGNGNTVWVKGIGGITDDSGFSVGVDSGGGVYAVGDFGLTVTLGGLTLTSRGGTDGFITKLDPLGNFLWAQQVGGRGVDDATSIAVGVGGVYVTGDFYGTVTLGGATLTSKGQNDVFIARLSTSGNVAWAKSFGGTGSDFGLGIATDDSGNAYVTGDFQGTATFGGVVLNSYGGYDAFGMRVDALGRVVFIKGIGSAGDDQAYQVAVGGPSTYMTLVGTYAGAAIVGNQTLPSTGTAYVVQISQYTAPSNGRPPSNFDNLGRSQPAVFRPSTAQWFVQGANGAGKSLGVFGAPGYVDIPVAGDYLQQGKSQLAVARPSTAQWFAQKSNGAGFSLGVFGTTNLNDIPITGDFLGLGYDQQGVFRPSTAQWFVNGPNGGVLFATFGATNLIDIPVPGDYDGTGKTQLAVFRASTAQWFILRPNGGQLLANFGATNLVDIPVPGDYDGLGQTQVAVFRPLTAQWFVLRPSGGALLTNFGDVNYKDVPTGAPFGALMALGVIGPGIRSFSVGSTTVGLNAGATDFKPDTLLSVAAGTSHSPQAGTGISTTHPGKAAHNTPRKHTVDVKQGEVPLSKPTFPSLSHRRFGGARLLGS